VSIPALFADGKCRAHILRSIEPDGLWLSSEELTARLLSENGRKIAEHKQPVFVPVVQVAAIILPPPSASTVQPSEAAATPAGATPTETVTAAKVGASRRVKPAGATPGAPPTDVSATRPK
jgi:hypothetical protein